jgi:S1-C subfamily serine protease
MSSSCSPSREPARPSRTIRGWLIRGSAAVAVAALVLWIVWQNADDRSARLRDSPRRAATAPNVAVGTASPARLSPGPAEALKRIEPCVVRIEADGPGGLEVVGSGFIVGPQGLVATSYHVAAQATQGVARFRDGRVHEIIGYAGLDRENDLALLQLRGATELNAAELSLDDPAPLATVVAVGHPQGIEFSPFDGKVSRIVTTSQLPTATQRFVRELTGSERDHRWIQHTANLSDGNSGGPLVDEQGRVVGINTWVDRQTGFGYALPASTIAGLIDAPPAEVEPLARHATSEARLQAQLWQTSAEQLTRLYDEARAMRWQPSSRRDYSRLQQLAFGITLANRPAQFGGRPALGERFDELVKAADQIVAQLRREQWNDAGQITLLNEFAAEELNRPLAGVFMIGTVERIFSGPRHRGATDRGQLAAIVVLAGFEQRLLVPLESGLNAPEPGSQCLIVGVNDRGRTVQYGENPLDPIVAPVVVAAEIIALGR